MRQAVFAILLILAAFSGGALFNGPGLAWAQRHLSSLADRLPNEFGSSSTGDDATVDPELKNRAPADPATASTRAPEPPSDGPELPRDALPVAASSPFADRVDEADGSESAPSSLPGDSGSTLDEPVRAPRGPSIGIASADIPETRIDPRSTPPRALPTPPPSLLDSARSKLANDRSAAVLEETAVNKSPTDSSSVRPDLEGENPAEDEGIAPPKARTPSDPSIRLASSSGAKGLSTEELAEWVEVQRRMVELGVGRFWVEGDFGGPVQFRCVVPVIGDRAVSQHFEAEGDDLLSAAQVALRRIALWRATEDLP